MPGPDDHEELEQLSVEANEASRDAELARLRSALEDSRRQLDRAQRRLDEIQASTSWRITRPLRATRSVLERLRHRSVRVPRLGPAGDTDTPPELGDEAITQTARAWAAARSSRAEEGTEAGGAELEPPVKLIAFYLPQFYPIPENDLWWGEGFTDWANVVRARSQFEGHYQPQLPTELGLYDLRLPEVLERQAELGRQYGVYGFCFHYYWFDGHRVLERPLDQLLARSSPALPFCCSWANENWTRRWDGRHDDVLLRQSYDNNWAERLIRDLLPVMADGRYVRVGDAALLLVYRVDELPDARRAAELWREIAQKDAGLDLHLAAVQSFGIDDPRDYGFDAAVEFPPHPFSRLPTMTKVRRLDREFEGLLTDYETIMRRALEKPLPDYPWYRGLMPSWDNTARRGRRAFVAVGSTPAAYRTWLRKLVLQALCRRDVQEPLLFVNAWNEWAEGTHLEPDDRYGRKWLEATLSGLTDGARRYWAAEGRPLSDEEALAHVRAAFGTTTRAGAAA